MRKFEGQSNNDYPYLAYGTDWLAFAHMVIAIAFIGPLRDPVRIVWTIQWVMNGNLQYFGRY